MKQIQNVYKVISNDQLCDRFYRLVIDAPEIAQEVEAGQFVHIRTAQGFEPFFRRPFSVYRAVNGVEVFYEPVGPGTELMTQLKEGDDCDVVGPVGTPFNLPDENIKQVVMIAGGIGIAPMLPLSDVLKDKDVELVLLYGGRTGGHVYEMQEFKDGGVAVYVATDDGSVGVKGRVTELFDKINNDPETTLIYTCGPNPMMAAVQAYAKEHQLKGQAACEEIMACALGACLGCSIPTTNGFKTVCYDGPCFDLHEIIFDH